jgi:hypothetical protein
MTRCPKCGSDQIVNDECLKCGVLVSKAHINTSTSLKPISYVAPETTGQIEASRPSTEGPSWRPMQDRIVSVPVKEKKNRIEKNIFLALLIVLLIGGGYQGYKYLVHRASAYKGYYRNDVFFFTLEMPDTGWSHYQSAELKKREFKDAHDAFYSGNDPENPDVTMLIWSKHLSEKIPVHFDPDTSRKSLDVIENEVQQRMEKAGLQCNITQSSPKIIGGNDGFVVQARVTKDQLNMKTIIFCGFNKDRAYTVQFLGVDEKMSAVESQINQIIDSFGYNISLI